MAEDLGTQISIPYVVGQASISFTAQYQPADGEGTVSKAGETAMFGTQAPDAPINVAVTELSYSDEGSIAKITWEQPSTQTSPTAVAKYSVYALAEGSEDKVGLTSTTDAETKSYTFNALAADTKYTFYVASQDNSATPVTSLYTASSEFTTYGATSYDVDDMPTYVDTFS